MKELIYKYPIIEAFNTQCECAFCEMEKKIEQNKIQFVIGDSSSYMESDIREKTDNKGFCHTHLAMLYNEKNRLGLALILSTHLKKLNSQINSGYNARKSLFKKNDKLSVQLNSIACSCFLCDAINATFDNYIDNYFHLYKKNIDVVELTKNSNGFCIKHFEILVRSAPSFLNGKQCDEFFDMIIPIQQKSLEVLEQDLLWFIDKFDYRNKDASWKNSKDALPRLINKLKGER